MDKLQQELEKRVVELETKKEKEENPMEKMHLIGQLHALLEIQIYLQKRGVKYGYK